MAQFPRIRLVSGDRIRVSSQSLDTRNPAPRRSPTECDQRSSAEEPGDERFPASAAGAYDGASYNGGYSGAEIHQTANGFRRVSLPRVANTPDCHLLCS